MTNWVSFFAKDDRLVAIVNIAALLALAVLLFGFGRTLMRFIRDWLRDGLVPAIQYQRARLDRLAQQCAADNILMTAVIGKKLSRVAGAVGALAVLSMFSDIIHQGPDGVRDLAFSIGYMSGVASGLCAWDICSLHLIASKVIQLRRAPEQELGVKNESTLPGILMEERS